MNKILISLLFCFGVMFGQGVPSITPGSMAVTIDKAFEETKVLEPIIVGSSPAGFFAYKVWIPANMQPYVNANPQVGMSLPNGTSVVELTVKTNNLNIGTYYFPVVMEGQAGNPYSISTHITLNVVNTLNPVSPDPVASDRMIPHVAAGGGWTTVVRLYNPTDSIIKQFAKFHDSFGRPVQLNVNGLYVSELPLVVLQRTVTELVFTGPTQIQMATAVIKMVDGPVPNINVIYKQASPVRETAVKMEAGVSEAMIKFDNRERKSTGLVIGNFGKDLQEIQIDVYDKHGIKKEAKFINVASMGSIVFATDQTYASLDEQEGSLIVRGVGKWLSIYAIQFDLTAETFSTEPGM